MRSGSWISMSSFLCWNIHSQVWRSSRCLLSRTHIFTEPMAFSMGMTFIFIPWPLGLIKFCVSVGTDIASSDQKPPAAPFPAHSDAQRRRQGQLENTINILIMTYNCPLRTINEIVFYFWSYWFKTIIIFHNIIILDQINTASVSIRIV